MGLLMQRCIVVLCLLFTLPGYAVTELLVVSAKGSKIELSRQQIKQLYLGARLSVDGVNLKPLVLPVGNRWRMVFNTKVMGLSEARIQSYWAQMKFTGRREEPNEVESVKSLTEALLNEAGSLGYLPKEQIDLNRFHVIYRIQVE